MEYANTRKALTARVRPSDRASLHSDVIRLSVQARQYEQRLVGIEREIRYYAARSPVNEAGLAKLRGLRSWMRNRLREVVADQHRRMALLIALSEP